MTKIITEPITAEEVMNRDDNLEIAEKHGITPDSLFAELKAELEAEETKLAQEKGVFTDEKNVIAWSTRQNALEKALRLLNLYPIEKVEHTLTLEDKLRAIHDKRDKE